MATRSRKAVRAPRRRRKGPSPDALDVVEIQSAVLVRNFELLRRRADIDSELDRAGYLLLRALDALGPSDINGVAAALGLDPSTAGRQVAVMQDEGLVERACASDDRRRSIVSVSAMGRARMAGASSWRRERTAELLADWSAADLLTLGEMFTRYNESVADRYLADSERVARAAAAQSRGGR